MLKRENTIVRDRERKHESVCVRDRENMRLYDKERDEENIITREREIKHKSVCDNFLTLLHYLLSLSLSF